MIKPITQYVVVCDNTFCDSIVRSVVDFHSYDRRQQFESKIIKLGWKIKQENNQTDMQKTVCPNCVLFASELEKKHPVLRPIKKSALTAN